MQPLAFFFLLIIIYLFFIIGLTKVESQLDYVSRRRLTTSKHPQPDDCNCNLEVDPSFSFESPRLKKAYCVFQEWKKAMFSDPQNFTGNWVGPNVCSYQGVFCTYALDDPNIVTVALIDLNYANIAGHLVPQIGLLTDLGLLHLHSNRFYGIVPETLSRLKLLFEFDVSNNRFVGPFPSAVLGMSSLKFIDIRYNEFEGALPPELFDKDLDAILVNNNRLDSSLPDNMGNSPASMIVLSNNKFTGCIPKSFGRMPRLEQVSLSNNRLTGCLPEEIGMLKALTMFDVSHNRIIGPLPKSLERLKTIERFDFSCNRLTGKVQESICRLPALSNFTISSNYFNEIGAECEKLSKGKLVLEDKDNCFPTKPNQKSEKVCLPVLSHPVDCKTAGCRPQNPSVVEPGNRKLQPIRQKPSKQPTPVPQQPKVTPPTPKPPLMPQPPKTPVVTSPPAPLVFTPPLTPSPPPSPVSSPPPAPVTSPPPTPLQSPPSPIFNDLILPLNIGSRYSSPPPPVSQGY